MISKSKLAEEIQTLQASATAICLACPRRDTTECHGPSCADIIRIVAEIDPLVTQFFRLELAEKRMLKHGLSAPSMWQRHLPLIWSDPMVGMEEVAATSEEVPLALPAPEDEPAATGEFRPPKGWRYGLLPFVLGWDSSRNAALVSPITPAIADTTVLQATTHKKREPAGSAPNWRLRSKRLALRKQVGKKRLKVVGERG